MALDPFLLSILVDPGDRGPLWYFDDEQLLYNPRAGHAYRIVDGIPVLLLDEVVALDEATNTRLAAREAQAVVTGQGGAPAS